MPFIPEAVPKLQFLEQHLDFNGKPGFGRFFREPAPKLTESWDKLT
jgi:hypothetical protein